VDKARHARLKKLVHNINRQRKVQARKIDILCNDMVQGHRSLLENLRHLAFASHVHESLIACCDADKVLKAVAETFGSNFCSRNTTLLLLEAGQVAVHTISGGPLAKEASELPTFFNAENIRGICRQNRSCLLPELLEIPVQIPPKLASQIAAAAIPLNFEHHPVGVLLFAGTNLHPIDEKLLRAASAAAPAIAKALAASGQFAAQP